MHQAGDTNLAWDTHQAGSTSVLEVLPLSSCIQEHVSWCVRKLINFLKLYGNTPTGNLLKVNGVLNAPTDTLPNTSSLHKSLMA